LNVFFDQSAAQSYNPLFYNSKRIYPQFQFALHILQLFVGNIEKFHALNPTKEKAPGSHLDLLVAIKS